MNHPAQTPPDLLIDSSGQPHWGIFPGSVPRINGLETDYRNALGKPVPHWRRRFHYKQFQYFGVISNDILIGCALADTAWLGLAFVYVFDARSGKLQLADESMDLGALGACGHHDFSTGFMRRETFWNWACFSGHQQGCHVGINLSCGVNETGYTENCLWLNGELIKVDTVRFEYNRDDLMQPWHVASQDGQIELSFTPRGNHREKLNVGLFASNFNQLFGQFHGVLRPAGRDPVEIRQLNGFVEEQYAKW